MVEDGSSYTQATDEFIVNLSDLRNICYHPNRKRTNGCCGLDGCDGRNLICINGHEIGTERSDCWHPHSASLDPSCVVLKASL